jgi:hypothetical protein
MAAMSIIMLDARFTNYMVAKTVIIPTVYFWIFNFLDITMVFFNAHPTFSLK